MSLPKRLARVRTQEEEEAGELGDPEPGILNMQNAVYRIRIDHARRNIERLGSPASAAYRFLNY